MKTYFDLVGEAPKENVSVIVSSDWMRVTYDYVKSEPKKDSEGNVVVGDNAYSAEYIELRGGIRSYDAIVSAIIEDKYPSDKMDAIRLNFELAQNGAVAAIDLDESKCDEYLAEYKEMQEWRIHAKEIARKAVELINANV